MAVALVAAVAWIQFLDPWPREIPHVMGMAKKKKRIKILNHISKAPFDV